MNVQTVSATLPPQSGPQTSAIAREPKVATPPAPEKQAVAKPVSDEQLAAAMQSIQEYIKPYNSNLEFSVNKDTDQVVIKVVDSATQEVLRQIPSEEMLALAKALDSLKGLFVKQTA